MNDDDTFTVNVDEVYRSNHNPSNFTVTVLAVGNTRVFLRDSQGHEYSIRIYDLRGDWTKVVPEVLPEGVTVRETREPGDYMITNSDGNQMKVTISRSGKVYMRNAEYTGDSVIVSPDVLQWLHDKATESTA